MKKLMFLGLIALLSSGCFPCLAQAGIIDSAQKAILAQKDSVTVGLSDLSDSAKLSFSKVYGDMKAGLAGLASSLKVGAEHVYRVLVMQQVVKSCTWLAVIVIPIIFMLLFLQKLYSWAIKSANSSDGFSFLILAFFVIANIVVLIIGLWRIEIILTGFINPEYGAIQDIIGFIK